MSKNLAPTLLVYPDAQKIFENASNPLTAIKQYSEEIRFIKVNMSNSGLSLDKIENAKHLYDKMLFLLDRYYDAYEDLRFRESADQTDVMASFFKGLSYPMAVAHPSISFTYYARLKSLYHFLEKMLTLVEYSFETGDERKLDTFFDIFGCKFIVHTGRATTEKDYPGAMDECYEILNDFITFILEKGGELEKPVSVGKTSEKIREPYRIYVKDYFVNPKPNGYMSLHASFEIVLKNKKRYFEVQVETQRMAANSDDGGLAGHDKYKNESKKKILTLDPKRIFFPGFIYPQDELGLFSKKLITKPKTYWAKV